MFEFNNLEKYAEPSPLILKIISNREYNPITDSFTSDNTEIEIKGMVLTVSSKTKTNLYKNEIIDNIPKYEVFVSTTKDLYIYDSIIYNNVEYKIKNINVHKIKNRVVYYKILISL